jgi:hypothetical protein
MILLIACKKGFVCQIDATSDPAFGLAQLSIGGLVSSERPMPLFLIPILPADMRDAVILKLPL